MTFRTLLLRSLRFHWRAHLGVLLGAAVGSAALIGALVVGDSVKESLRERALERLGNIQYAVAASDRLFRAELADALNQHPSLQRFLKQGGRFIPALRLAATASRADGQHRANQVQLLGVDESFTVLTDDRFKPLPSDAVYLNEALAAQLAVQKGDVILLRVRKPSALAGDAVVSPRSDSTVALRLRVSDVLSDDALGNFSLSASQTARYSAFVSLALLQEKASTPGQANLLLMQTALVELSSRVISQPERFLRDWFARLFKTYTTVEFVEAPDGKVSYYIRARGRLIPFENGLYGGGRNLFFKKRSFLDGIMNLVWQLPDAGLELRVLASADTVELRTPRVFLDQPTVGSVYQLPGRWVVERGVPGNLLTNWATVVNSNAQPILTYLANLLRAGTNATPYSMVTAAGVPWTPPDMRDDEILVSQWLADDLRVKPGDTVELSYFLPESGARLTEATNRFRVRVVVPMELPWADRTLMPEFPGIEKAESTAEWDTAFPLVHKIRPKDEQYWKDHRGTPKAFVTLAAGQRMWGNRFGNLTAIRFPVPTKPVGTRSTAFVIPAQNRDGVESVPTITAEEYRASIERKILATLQPEEVGLRFEPVREQALQAAAQSQDFGQLFLGFSIFLIAAALLLMALLFQLGVEQRATEIGTLLALGFRPKQVRRLLLWEGVALALLGGVLGSLGGVGYAKAMLHGLATIWRDAVGASALQFHATAQSLAIGLLGSVVAAALAIWLTLRGLARRPASELLAGEVQSPKSKVQSGAGWVAGVALALALGLVGWAMAQGETASAGIFFGAGALLLVAGLALISTWLANLAGAEASKQARAGIPAAVMDFRGGRDARPTLGSLALSGATRRRKRSLATVGLLACGSFLIAAVGVFRLDANRDATRRSSGTGGFAFIGESTLPVVQDLNTKAGREAFGLGENDMTGVSAVAFRVRDGDEASCLNLNRAQRPRLLGVKPEALEGRFTFSKGAGWRELVGQASRPSLLERNTDKLETGVTPVLREILAIGDAASIQWALGKKVGDTIDYVDEHGQRFKVRIVAAVANSILQGSLVIDEAEFVKRFPSESGYRFFLLDAPTNAVGPVSATLSRALQDYGLELTPAVRRLAQFNAVQNTYLGTFQVLGGLGLLLGSAGLGVVVLRNVLERRGELAVLLAVGFRRRALGWLVLAEHGALLALGLGVGILAAAVAVLPQLLSPGTPIPWASLALTLAGVVAVGAVSAWLATRWALRGDLLAALRNE